MASTENLKKKTHNTEHLLLTCYFLLANDALFLPHDSNLHDSKGHVAEGFPNSVLLVI